MTSTCFILPGDISEPEDLLESEDDAPIIRMLNALLTQAVKEGATDIHIEPYETQLRGALPRRRHAARGGAAQRGAARRVCLAPEDHGRLDIAEKRLPQDGRISLRIGGARSTCASRPCPTRHGERVGAAPARQAGRSDSTCDSLGMSADMLAGVQRADRSSRTASCSSPGPPARARRPRCTPRWTGSTTAPATS